MMSHTVLGLTLVWLLALPLTGFAQSHHLEIDFNDSRIRSNHDQPATLHLKRALLDRYPGLVPSDLHLRKAVLVARSRYGRGTARLRVGEQVTAPHQVGGGGHEYDDHRFSPFHRIRLVNPSFGSRGPWQILLDGGFVVHKVIVVAEDRLNRRPARYNTPSSSVPGPYQSRPHGGAIMLPPRVWGTDMETEKPCNQRTDNAPDGWDKPQNVCRSQGEARFTRGYAPSRLYIRPDVSRIKRVAGHRRFNAIRARLTAIGCKAGGQHTVSGTLGIDIGGQTFTRQFKVRPGKGKGGKSDLQILLVHGRWSPQELHRAKIWVRPNHSRADFKVRQLSIEVLGG